MLSVALDTIVCAQQPVLQRGYDAGLSGANLSETTLTTSNVNPTTFGLVFTLPVDDKIYAQPLYVPGVQMLQGTHNVVYVATMSDTLYAFDADVGGAPLWSVNFASSVGATPVAIANFTFAGNTNIVGNMGILSTPVIDPSTNIMYLVACTLESGTMVYRLHAVNITNGTEPYPNVVISGSYAGVSFDAAHQTQRVSLTLAGNQVVFGFGAMEAESNDTGGYSGWMMAYNKQTLAQSGVFATNTTGGTLGGGIWQSGRAPAVDSAGYVYVFTGNGYNSGNGYNGYDGVHNFAETALKLNPAAGMALVGWFTPSNWASMDANDQDLSSSGPLVVPGTSPPLLAGGGKTGVLYVLDTTALPNNATASGGGITVSGSSLRGGPVYWQRSAANGGPLLYDWASNDWVKAFAFNGTTFASSPTYQGSTTFNYPGGILALSANGQLQGTGVLWATVATSGNVYNDATDPGALYAFDADNVGTQLYSSNFGNFAKLVPPLVANGKVYVATFSDQVAVYGLLNSEPTAAPPMFSLTPGTYTGTQQVSLSDTTSGATIYYTINGTSPTTSPAKQYVPGTQLSIGSTTTIEAIAAASGYNNSTVSIGTYTISAGGTTPVSVSLSTADNLIAIGNTGTAVSGGGGIDGQGDVYAESLLGASLTWSGSTFTLGPANVVDAASGGTITLPAGNYSSVNLLATGVDGNQPNQTFVVTYTDGTTTSITQSLSDWFTPQYYAGESIAATMAYRITGTGATDTRPFYLYGYSLAINSGKTVQSITLPNNRNVVVLSIDVVPTGSTQPMAATPMLSLTSGTYSGPQQVSLSDTTSGATIYYTINGTTPTIASTPYVPGMQLTIGSTTTIEAIAVASGYTNSAPAIGTYTISAGGTTPVSVSLSTADNLIAIGNIGTTVSGTGGIDGQGNVYAESLLGTSLTWSGSTFTLGTANVADAASGGTITLPAGSYSSVNLLATAVGGNQPNQSFVVTYTDGTTTNITQSLSDWFTPQSYAGESIASTMAYRITASGATDNRAFYLYGYSLAISSAKTVQSITLPKNANVAVLAIDVVPMGSTQPAAATPQFSLAQGTYSGTQQVTLSDTTSGATIYYTIDGTTPTIASTPYVPGTQLSISSTTTIEAIAVASGYTSSTVAVATYTISAGGTTPVSVSLSVADTLVAIGNTGTAVSSGGIDGLGNVYAASLLGTSLTWSGSTFTLGTANVADAASGATITLPAGNYASVNLLATGVGGNQPNQTFVVTYTDATTTSITQSLSDWFTPQSYTGESIASTMAYRITASGATDNRPFYLYGYSFAVNSAKTVKSITLPSNRNVVVLAIDVVPTGSTQPVAATPQFSLTQGTYSGTQQVTLTDATSGATIYYTINGPTPTTSSTLYIPGTLLSISATSTIQAIAVENGYTNSNVGVATYTISAQPVVATPQFSLPQGSYSGTQQVMLSDATSGAVIYYTTDGTTPTTSSMAYAGGSLSISTTTTIEAMAVASNTNSTVAIATYTISDQPTVATPQFSLPQGSYSGTQQVTISDATSGATIYYTINGPTPTTSSPLYVPGTLLSISANSTIQAIAVAGGYINSSVQIATYTISAPGTTPVSVGLSAADSIVGIGNAGTAVSSSGGIDGQGDVYAESLLGTSLTWSGSTFALGTANVVDAVSGATITLPAGNYSSVNLLATGTNGNQRNQTFVVTYTDGTTTSITQSLSDWFTPQSYTGESIASTMAYRVKASGSTSNGPFYLYGYSLAVNSAKTIQSITLPKNRNVVVLAIDVVPTGSTQPTVTTPQFSLPQGSYSGTQQVTLSDTTSGAVIYYTITGTAPTLSSPQYVPGTPISISATTTVEAMAVASGYTNSNVAIATYTISAPGTTPVGVSLSAADNVVAIGNTGTAVSGSGGVDRQGDVYAESLLGTSLTWSGSTFALGTANVVDAVSGGTITLPAGNYSSVNLLATGTNGNQPNQTFVVTYTDGTTTSITQSLSDWYTSEHYAGESVASTMAYRVKASGNTGNGPYYLYGYSFAINNAKTVQSIALPNNRNVVVLAVDLAP